MRVAAFVTPHGFGHAGRACAVLDALHALRPETRATLFTTVPDAFFGGSLTCPWERVPVEADVGMVQRGALDVDLAATVRSVAAFLDALPGRAEALARTLREGGYDVALCDLAPLGIEAARRAGVPSVLVENFTWDWIYAPLVEEEPALAPLVPRLAALFDAADVRVQAEPVGAPRPDAMQVGPVARAPRLERAAARNALGLVGDEPAVMVTLGGVPQDLPFLDALRARGDVAWVVTGLARRGREGNLVFLHRDEPVYLPDALRAVDAVVAKLGYSTVAEAWRAGRPLVGVTRTDFREAPVLAAWLREALPGFTIGQEAFLSGEWIARVDALLALPTPPEREGGAADAARAVADAAALAQSVPPGVDPRR